eukprot:Sdes_comp20438_c0_seq3m14600
MPDAIEAGNYPRILSEWLNMLPILHDRDESLSSYDFLCVLVESSNDVVLGESYSNIPKLVSVFCTGLSTNFVDAQFRNRITNLLRHLFTLLPESTKSNCISSLPS